MKAKNINPEVPGYLTSKGSIIIFLNDCMAVLNNKKEFLGFRPTNYYLAKILQNKVMIDFSIIPIMETGFFKKIGTVKDHDSKTHFKKGIAYKLGDNYFIEWFGGVWHSYDGAPGFYNFPQIKTEEYVTLEELKDSYSLQENESHIDMKDIFPGQERVVERKRL